MKTKIPDLKPIKKPRSAEEVDYELDVLSMAIKTLDDEIKELRKRVEALEHGTPDQEKGMARKQYDGLMNSGKL